MIRHSATALSIVIFFLTLVSVEAQQTLRIRHDHDPWGSCKGELIISEKGIEYRTDKDKHNRDWSWTDIQSFDRKSPGEFSVLSYEDLRMRLGADRRFDFTILPGTDPLAEETHVFIAEHLKKPLTDRITREIEAEYQVPVKHLHTFGGCEGVLYFGKDWIVYETDHAEDSRTWKRDREVESVWSLNRYQLEIRVFEENQRAFDKTRRFRFQLKQPLNEEYYSQLRREFLPGR